MFNWNRGLIHMVKMLTPAKINKASDFWWNVSVGIYMDFLLK